MACTPQTLAGIELPCEGSKGGIVTVYARIYDDNIFTEAQGAITAVAATQATAEAESEWKEYHFRKNSSSMSSTLTVDPANGVNFVSTTLNMVFSRMDTTKRVEMAAMALADMAIIVKDANGEYYALGVSEPVTASEGTGETGTQRTDGNRYSISLVDNQDSFPMMLTEAAVTAFLGKLKPIE